VNLRSQLPPETSIGQLDAVSFGDPFGYDIRRRDLRNWGKQDELDSGEREGPTTDKREELRRLRREVRVLRQEKETLGSAPGERDPKESGHLPHQGGGRGR
jgi:hypothetical protein